MWIQTRYGAYSLACARKDGGASALVDPDLMMIRARRREHLENLQGRFPELAAKEIVQTPATDYRWRIFLPKEELAVIVAELVREQTWANFKNEVARYEREECPESDGAYRHALHEIWSTLHRLQHTSNSSSSDWWAGA